LNIVVEAQERQKKLTMDQTTVLIVGTGPAGATLALHLGKLGIKSIFISRHRGTANTPRAHIFNQRAMEVLRDAGVEDRAKEVASSSEDMQHTSWSNTLAGEEYGRMYAWGNKPSELGRYEDASPCKMSDLPQSFLEPILVDEAVKSGAQVRFGHEYISHVNHGDHVETTLKDRDTQREYSVSSKYLVGADGARSPVIEALGIPVIGKTINSAFNVHIQADLSKYMKHRPGSLNWILNTEAPQWSAVGNFRMVRPWGELIL
jgi:2-polyprenyl-6-methoxyphenol hydroxylase-like FAD-dependent oxidoreductase